VRVWGFLRLIVGLLGKRCRVGRNWICVLYCVFLGLSKAFAHNWIVLDSGMDTESYGEYKRKI
jgi:hypothetical protein